MTISFVDVCRFTPTTGGTGDFVVSAATTGYLTPANAGAANGATYRYRAESADLSQWEVGFGTYTSGTTTLARTTILKSSNANAKVNFGAAPAVALVYLAEDAMSSQNNLADVASTSTSLSNLGGVPTTRSVSAGGIATGGGALSADRTITVTAAVKSDQTTATSTSVVVVPGVQHNHPSAVKAWVKFAGSTATIASSYNVSSVTRNGTGDYTINFGVAFASADYVGIAQGGGATSTIVQMDRNSSSGANVTQTTTAQRFSCYNAFGGGGATDPTAVYYVAFGTQ
jgi:hypothetical protein